jgi:hypothetical protein
VPPSSIVIDEGVKTSMMSEGVANPKSVEFLLPLKT